MSIKVNGTQQVIARLQQVLDNAHNGANAAIGHGVDVTFDGSQVDCPVGKDRMKRTGEPTYKGGALKASGAKAPASDLYGEVSYGTNHCWYPELGTVKMRARPYLYPNFINRGVPTVLHDLKAMKL